MTTKLIANHSITLIPGKWYIATRPMASRRDEVVFPVTISDSDNQPVVVIGGLGYDQANELINSFNNGPTSFDGRVW